MYLTIEELYALREQYTDELRKAQAKVDVISDLIKLAEVKEPVKSENGGAEETETETVVIELVDDPCETTI